MIKGFCCDTGSILIRSTAPSIKLDSEKLKSITETPPALLINRPNSCFSTENPLFCRSVQNNDVVNKSGGFQVDNPFVLSVD